MGEPTPDQSRCDVGDHQRCSGYTEDESDPETCMCHCHDGWGMTDRPYPAVVVGTAAGGPDPQFLGGSGARAMVAAERAAGRWADQPANHPLAVGRSATHDGQRITVAEAGVLQGFPRDYPWQGSRNHRAQQVANAVPPPMAATLIQFVTEGA